MSPRGEISRHKGLKILCVTIPPRGQFCKKIDESILCIIPNYYMFK